MTDRSWPQMIDVVIDLEKLIDKDDEIYFLSYARKSEKINNVQIVNVNEFDQGNPIEYYQNKYKFSIWRALVTERAYFNFTSMKREQIYSRLRNDEVYEVIRKYLNALDYIIENIIDITYENSFDTFIATLACYISKEHNKKFYSVYLNYYDDNSLFFFDKVNWTSSEIYADYEKIYDQAIKYGIDDNSLGEVDEYFQKKKSLYQIPNNNIKIRIKQLIIKEKGFEPISIKNLILRRIINKISKTKFKLFIKTYKIKDLKKKFVLYPLHVSPEAALLGTSPEYADQISMIRNIAINLPFGVILCIKEHPHQKYGVGGCNYQMLKMISELPNVVFLNSGIDMRQIISHPNYLTVIGINGTVLLEAMIEKRPGIVIGEPYYLSKEYYEHIREYKEITEAVKAIINKKNKVNEIARYAMLAAIKKSAVVVGESRLGEKEGSQIEFAKGFNKIISKHLNIIRQEFQN